MRLMAICNYYKSVMSLLYIEEMKKFGIKPFTHALHDSFRLNDVIFFYIYLFFFFRNKVFSPFLHFSLSTMSFYIFLNFLVRYFFINFSWKCIFSFQWKIALWEWTVGVATLEIEVGFLVFLFLRLALIF